MKIEEIITDAQLDHAWGNADFGDTPKRDIVRFTLLKYACGYSSGKFAKEIVKELGLINEAGRPTKKGREYLYLSFSEGKSY